MRNSNGWDGKQRVDRTALVTNPEAVEDPEYSDSDAPTPEEIEADEGMPNLLPLNDCETYSGFSAHADLLEDEDPDAEVILGCGYFLFLRDSAKQQVKDIDLVHSRIQSIPALRLERFTKLQVCRNSRTTAVYGGNWVID